MAAVEKTFSTLFERSGEGLGHPEHLIGHQTASRSEASHSLDRRGEMPGSLPDRYSFVSPADPDVVVTQEALGGHDA